jgi:hypothetical protein
MMAALIQNIDHIAKNDHCPKLTRSERVRFMVPDDIGSIKRQARGIRTGISPGLASCAEWSDYHITTGRTIV